MGKQSEPGTCHAEAPAPRCSLSSKRVGDNISGAKKDKALVPATHIYDAISQNNDKRMRSV